MRKYEKDATLEDIPSRDLKYLPLSYYVDKVRPSELRRVWFKLPYSYRQSEELQMKLPCLDHYNNGSSETHFDGPPPSKRNCIICNLQKK